MSPIPVSWSRDGEGDAHPSPHSLAQQLGVLGPTCVLWNFLNPDEGSAGTSEALTAYLQGETQETALLTTSRAGSQEFWGGELRMHTQKKGIFLLFDPGMPQ